VQEFRRLDSSYGAARDRAQLLGGVETLPLLSVQVGCLLGNQQVCTTCVCLNSQDHACEQLPCVFLTC
jgi:hypothetical protein